MGWSQQGHKEPYLPHWCEWVSKGLHATFVYSPTSLLSQPPEKQDIFLSIKDLCLLLWRSRAGVHGLLGPTSRRRLRSRWSRGIFYRVLKDIVTVTYLQFQFINKICVLLFYLSKTVGPPQKIRKIYAISDFAFFFETPCRDFQHLKLSGKCGAINFNLFAAP